MRRTVLQAAVQSARRVLRDGDLTMQDQALVDETLEVCDRALTEAGEAGTAMRHAWVLSMAKLYLRQHQKGAVTAAQLTEFGLDLLEIADVARGLR